MSQTLTILDASEGKKDGYLLERWVYQKLENGREAKSLDECSNGIIAMLKFCLERIPSHSISDAILKETRVDLGDPKSRVRLLSWISGLSLSKKVNVTAAYEVYKDLINLTFSVPTSDYKVFESLTNQIIDHAKKTNLHLMWNSEFISAVERRPENDPELKEARAQERIEKNINQVEKDILEFLGKLVQLENEVRVSWRKRSDLGFVGIIEMSELDYRKSHSLIMKNSSQLIAKFKKASKEIDFFIHEVRK